VYVKSSEWIRGKTKKKGKNRKSLKSSDMLSVKAPTTTTMTRIYMRNQHEQMEIGQLGNIGGNKQKVLDIADLD
jgi:hypothetical protein